jgi:hypothetical protein
MHEYGTECKKNVMQLAEGASEQDSRVQRGPGGKRTCEKLQADRWGLASAPRFFVEELKVYFRVVHHFSYFQ